MRRDPSRHFVGVPRTGRTPEPLLAGALDPALDASVYSLEKYGLRARPSAPHAPCERRRVDEPEADPGQEEKEEPGVLRVEGGPEKVELARVYFDEKGRMAADADPRQRGPEKDERREDDVASPMEPSRHVRRMNGAASAVDRQRRGRELGLVEDGQLEARHTTVQRAGPEAPCLQERSYP